MGFLENRLSDPASMSLKGFSSLEGVTRGIPPGGELPLKGVGAGKPDRNGLFPFPVRDGGDKFNAHGVVVRGGRVGGEKVGG